MGLSGTPSWLPCRDLICGKGNDGFRARTRESPLPEEGLDRLGVPDSHTNCGVCGNQATLSLIPVCIQMCSLRSPLAAGVYAVLSWRP